MERREFLKKSTCLAVAGLLHRSVRGAGLPPRGESRTGLPLAIARGRDYRERLRDAADAIGGPALFAASGEHVLIKPVLAWHRAPGQGANVHPEVLRAAIEMAIDGGARRVTVLDRTSMRARTVYRVSGAQRVVAEFLDRGVELVELTDADFVPLGSGRAGGPDPLSRRGGRPLSPDQLESFQTIGASLDRFRICRYLLAADRVVNIATLRHHPTRRASLGLANLLGLVGGWPTHPAWTHLHDAELALLGGAVRPELTILDATRPILANGPAGRGPADVGRWDAIAVSRDPVAIEAHGASLLGVPQESLPHIRFAVHLGLGCPVMTEREVEV